MLIKRCDKCGQDVGKVRRFTIQEVDPIYNYVHVQPSVYDKKRLNLKESILDLCVTCAKTMGFEDAALVKEEKSIEGVFRKFIEVLVEDAVAEHSHEE